MDLGVIDVGVNQRVEHRSGSRCFARCEESTLCGMEFSLEAGTLWRGHSPNEIVRAIRISITNAHLIIHSNLILHRHLISHRHRHLSVTNFHLSNENYIAHESTFATSQPLWDDGSN